MPGSKVEIDLNKENDREESAIISEQDHDPDNDRFAAIENQIRHENAFLSSVAETIVNLDRLLKRIRLPLWFAVVLLFLILIQNL